VNQSMIFAPMFCMFLLTFTVWIYLYARRIPFIQRSNLSPEQLTPVEFERIAPPEVANPSDNFKNLFEIPVLFYALCIYLFVTSEVDITYLIAAWVFVMFRVAHSAVHCTVNIVILRFWLYATATAAFWFMAARAGLELLGY